MINQTYTFENETSNYSTTIIITKLSHSSNYQTPFEFDRHTVILISAFLVGLLTISIAIILAICCCKSNSIIRNGKNRPKRSHNNYVNSNNNLADDNHEVEMISLKQINDTNNEDEQIKNDTESEKTKLIDVKNDESKSMQDLKISQFPETVETEKTNSQDSIKNSVTKSNTNVSIKSISNISSSSTLTLNSKAKQSSKATVYLNNEIKNEPKIKSLMSLNNIKDSDTKKDRRSTIYSKIGAVQSAVLKPAKSINSSDQTRRNSAFRKSGNSIHIDFDNVAEGVDAIANHRIFNHDSFSDINNPNKMNSATDLYFENLNGNKGKSREQLNKNGKQSTSTYSLESEKSCY